MPPSQRLADLEELIETNYQKLAKFQKRLDRTASIREEFDIEGDIPKIRKAIRSYEADYWKLLAQEVNFYEPEEGDAESAIFQVKAEVLRVINNQPHVNDELMRLLVEIRDKLNEPGPTAAAKAKLALNLIPGFLVYEFELDTENSLRRLRQPIVQLFQKALNEGK